MHKQKTEDMDSPTSATLPRRSGHNNDALSSESVFTGSLPRNTPSLASKWRRGVEFSTSASVHNRGKSTNMAGLFSGLQQLRCLLDMMLPGVLPGETVAGVLLDLVSQKVTFFLLMKIIIQSLNIFSILFKYILYRTYFCIKFSHKPLILSDTQLYP